MREIIARIMDAGEFEDTAPNPARRCLCGYSRIGAGCRYCRESEKTCANSRARLRQKRMEFGRRDLHRNPRKSRRFILDCNQNRIPLIFLHDVNGFMVGKDAEWSGIIRAGAKMVTPWRTALYQKSTVICAEVSAREITPCAASLRSTLHVRLAHRALRRDERDAAAATLVEIKLKQLEREGKKSTRTEKGIVRFRPRHYEHQTDRATPPPPLGRRHH